MKQKSGLLFVLLAMAACSGDENMPRLDGEEPPGGEEDPLADIEGIPFDKLTHEQRIIFMRYKVVPTLGEMFTQFDPVRFEQVGCKTCHGSKPAAVNYEMPGDIKMLNFNELPDDPIVGFMAQTVVPEMAKLLEREPFDPGTGEGEFGCTGCHRIADDVSL
jgi:hypothetical protein